ncbi:Hsp20/alpha crystallin family protein [Arthrobacter sp. TMT4-20]|uniref:Hsp20/alpha crystallin family protein n=1 Tax=Arthrobacter sp. TB 23 TaxID=494419 RepID=UPI0002F4DC1A|nr:Hsp20/alpha crystallin family protein [Arthrobacter sp. TB 23]
MSDLSRWSPLDLLNSMDRLFDTKRGASPIRVEEYVDGDHLVVKAEVPGVDPDKDIEITLDEGFLNIRAERREHEEHKDGDDYHSEFRYGSFSRTVPLPAGVKEEDIKAQYVNGVLEVRLPVPKEPAEAPAPKKVPISRG